MRILLAKLLLPCAAVAILYEPFFGVLFFMGIAFVRPEVLTWGMADTRFALLASAVTLTSWLLRIQNPAQRATRIPGQFYWFMAVVAAIGLSSIFAEASRPSAWDASLKFIKYGVFLFLMIQMINTGKRLRYVQEVMFWGVNFLAVWGADQYFRGNYRLEQVGGGDIVDSSALAALMILMFPMTLLRVHHPRRLIKFGGLLFGSIYLIVIVFTESRSGFLGTLVAFTIIFLRVRHRLRLLIAAVPVVMLLVVAMPDTFSERMETIFSKNDEGIGQPDEVRERSADQRLKIWAVAWAVFKDHPILGVGRGNFGLVHQEYAYPIWYGRISEDLFADLFNRYRVCHSIVFDLLASNGILTFVLWFLLVLSTPYSLYKMREKLGDSPTDNYWRYQSYGIEAGILGYIVTGLFQDLVEFEVFYWVLVLGGIMTTVVPERRETEEASDETPTSPSLPGIMPPDDGLSLNPWQP